MALLRLSNNGQPISIKKEGCNCTLLERTSNSTDLDSTYQRARTPPELSLSFVLEGVVVESGVVEPPGVVVESGVVEPPGVVVESGVVEPPGVVVESGVVEPPGVVVESGVVEPPGVVVESGVVEPPGVVGTITSPEGLGEVGLEVPGVTVDGVLLGDDWVGLEDSLGLASVGTVEGFDRGEVGC